MGCNGDIQNYNTITQRMVVSGVFFWLFVTIDFFR